MAAVPNHVGNPVLPEATGEEHERPNAGLWKKAIAAFRAASRADEKVIKSDKPAVFVEYVGRVAECGGAVVVKIAERDNEPKGATAGERYTVRTRCHFDADPKYGICDDCSAKEQENRRWLRDSSKPSEAKPVGRGNF